MAELEGNLLMDASTFLDSGTREPAPTVSLVWMSPNTTGPWTAPADLVLIRAYPVPTASRWFFGFADLPSPASFEFGSIIAISSSSLASGVGWTGRMKISAGQKLYYRQSADPGIIVLVFELVST